MIVIIYLLATNLGSEKPLQEMNHFNHEVSIKSERDFIEHMIPHHEEAVKAATELIGKGTKLRPVHDLAEQIIDKQNIEVEEMKVWYLSWYEVDYQDVGVYAAMMRNLSELSGAELERTFLEDMILHHEAAILAANQVLKLSISKQTEGLAKEIITTQENEIELMQNLLKLLPLQ